MNDLRKLTFNLTKRMGFWGFGVLGFWGGGIDMYRSPFRHSFHMDKVMNRVELGCDVKY